MRNWNINAGLTAAALLAIGAAASAGTNSIATTRVASGLTLPCYATSPNGDFSRLFIVEQRSSGGVSNRGDIRVLNLPGHTLNGSPYLSVTGLSTGNEQGLLGLAFHPDFINNGYFFVDYTNSAGTTVIARYQANAPYATSTSANAASATTILTIAQPFSNHNGGWISFGPDGNLYIAMGDGGSGNDPNGNAQNVNALLGKILRIDVDGADNIPGNDDDNGVLGDGISTGYTNPIDNPFFGATNGRDEVWAYGVRNPFRNSFDRLTGELYLGDVGQDTEEEISWQPAHTMGTLPGQPGYMGGRNYGWKCYEGNSCRTGNCGGCPDAIPSNVRIAPIATFRNSGGGSAFAPFTLSGCAVTGGYVYRGCAIPDLQGVYFFTDYCTPQFWTFRNSNGVLSEITNRSSQISPSINVNGVGGGFTVSSVTSFGEDAYGEMYIVDQGGEVFKIVPTTPPPVDCDSNGQNDACQILANPALDANNNGVLDSCEPPPVCAGDANGDNAVNSADLSVLLTNFGGSGSGPSFGDFNNDGLVNSADLSILLGNFGNFCH